MSVLVRTLAVAFIVFSLVTPIARGQEFPMSDRQKANIERQKAYEKATDEAYQAAMKRSHDAKQKTVDPWANVRAPSTGGGN